MRAVKKKPAKLAKALGLSPSYITMALDKLEGRGLIRRETNERDRFQENAQAVTDGLYLVPKVIE